MQEISEELIQGRIKKQERPRPIERSSRNERACFLARTLAPKIIGTVIQYLPVSETTRNMMIVRKCLLDNSKTYALALQTVVDDFPKLGDDLVIAHQGFKLLDFGEENREFLRKQRKDFLERCIDTLASPSPQKIKDLETRVSPLINHPAFDQEFKSILTHLPAFIGTFQNRPPEVQKVFLKYADRMAKGFANPEVQKIHDLTDVHRYCLIAAGYVGYCVTENFAVRNYLKEEEAAALMPSALIMGKAVQLGNNLRDFFKDFESGMWRWPARNTEAIARARTPEDISHVYENEFKEIVDYTKKHFVEATQYFDQLPTKEPYGPKIFSGLGLAAYAAVVGRVASRNFVYTRGGYKKPTRNEALDIRDIITHYAQRGESIKPLINHLLENKPAKAFFE